VTPTVRQIRTVRYIVGSAPGAKLPVTRGNMLTSLVFNTAGTTTNYRLVECARLISVDIYSIAQFASGTAPSDVGIQWVSEHGPAITHLVTALGSANPTHIHVTPPKGTLAGFWSTTGVDESQVMIEFINLDANDVVDVKMEIVLQDFSGFGAPTAYTSTATGVAGTMYTTPLDGASGKIIPTGISALS